MEFVNRTPALARWFMGFEPDGRERLIVTAKMTFAIPPPGAPATLAPQQMELVEADRFTGAPGLSAPLYETDFAQRKPFCDVLLNGSAHAAPGRQAAHLDVGLQVGALAKAFRVLGHRQWHAGLFTAGVGRPQPFASMPISYDNAYGGTETDPDDALKMRTFEPNPVGRGYLRQRALVDGAALPNTEEIGQPITDAGGRYRPMAFGPVGRNWRPRYTFAGTYDQAWLDGRAPLWPHDFDYRYFQAAPADQQMPHPLGGETVLLKNLTPAGTCRFQLPRIAMPMLFVPHRGPAHGVDAVVDTLLIEPDLGRFSLTWRSGFSLSRNTFELREVVVGDTLQSWQHRQRRTGKRHYAGLGELVRARRR